MWQENDSVPATGQEAATRTCHAVSLPCVAANDAEPDEASTWFCWTPDYTGRLPSANPRAAASALSSGRVLKAIAAPGAAL